MNPDFIFALYVFCCDYHSGQWSRGYRILSRIAKRGIRISDSGMRAIQGNRHTRTPFTDWSVHAQKRLKRRQWQEWEQARVYYRELKRKYAGKV